MTQYGADWRQLQFLFKELRIMKMEGNVLEYAVVVVVAVLCFLLLTLGTVIVIKLGA